MNTLQVVRKECCAFSVTDGKNSNITRVTLKKNLVTKKNVCENNFVHFFTKMKKLKKCRLK